MLGIVRLRHGHCFLYSHVLIHTAAHSENCMAFWFHCRVNIMKGHTSLYGNRPALSRNFLLHQMTSRGDEKDAAGVAGLIIFEEDKGIKPFAKGSVHTSISIGP